MTRSRWIVLVVVAALVVAFFGFGLDQYLSLDVLRREQSRLAALVSSHPVAAGLAYFAIYVSVTALSLPGAAIMTLAGGAVFGLGLGVLIVSFASTIGATFAMLVARFVLREQVRKRFGKQLERIDAGIEKEGGFYLFTLRLVPVFPFFAINLAMGLTRISVPVFFFVSQAGMLAGTIVYVNAGTQLADISSLSDIASFDLLASFTLLGVFPLIAKKLVDVVRARRVYAAYVKPRQFDRDVVVIGAGSGGLVAALIVATVKGKVTLIEKNRMGGDCLNTGCVPSKTLIRSARLAADMRRADAFGLKAVEPQVDFGAVMDRVQSVIKAIEPHDSVERYQSLGVDVALGEARILSPFEVQVGDRVIKTRSVIVATGASPFVPPIEGLDAAEVLTSENVWSLREKPARLVVMGGGPIGVELAQAMRRLGSEVTVVEALPRILTREDPDVSTMMAGVLEDEGISLKTGYRAIAAQGEAGKRLLVVQHVDTGEQHLLPYDGLLVAVGRKANVSGFGLEELGVEIAPQGTIAVDEYLRTKYPNIYAIGDVAGPYQFTHTASHMAWYAAVNALFGTFRKFKVDYGVIPWTTFTSPEVARVGLNESDAVAKGMEVEVTTYDIAHLDRALADGETQGMVKVITAPGSDRVLGVTIVAEHAGEIIAEYVLAMKQKIGLKQIMGTIHIYPTLTEMNKFAASEWRKAHKPDALLDWVGRWHSLRRGEGFRRLDIPGIPGQTPY